MALSAILPPEMLKAIANVSELINMCITSVDLLFREVDAVILALYAI